MRRAGAGDGAPRSVRLNNFPERDVVRVPGACGAVWAGTTESSQSVGVGTATSSISAFCRRTAGQLPSVTYTPSVISGTGERRPVQQPLLPACLVMSARARPEVLTMAYSPVTYRLDEGARVYHKHRQGLAI